MIKLTVLYKLKPEISEEEFLEWRLTDHQTSNSSIPGVVKTDFTRIHSAWPDKNDVPYRFMTTVDWPDMKSFEAGFYDSAVQESLKKNLEMLQDPVFLIGEILIEQQTQPI